MLAIGDVLPPGRSRSWAVSCRTVTPAPPAKNRLVVEDSDMADLLEGLVAIIVRGWCIE